ncbi:fasciclin-like arabinogalactan protein 3 [Coffea eugenioides]|uniref:fasciclin-like arabinogalactan protein 3 n=1 Tax=Coffea eugenioides TaxID=49369 RepID=UPI000F61094C|nr:fasciclin-like arabinogalactan protein 3 [Coffea eugenioides]
MGASKISTSLIFLSCLLLASSATTAAFNITAVLGDIPSFSNFNELLSKAGLVKAINSQSPVTILAIPNEHIGDLAGKPADVIKITLMTHVVLDYYDLLKLANAKNGTRMTTLFQKTGVATYDQGFLILNRSHGQLIFSSAAKGAPHNVQVVATVTQHPFNYSIISVSSAIMTPGVDGTTLQEPPKAAGAPAPAKKVSPPPASEAPEAPTPSDDATAPSPDAPSDAPKSDAPASQAPAADADDDKNQNASFKHLASSTLGFVAVLASFLAAY